MPQVEVDGLRVNYDVQGEGEPLLLIPYTSADHACYAFQLPAYTEHFRCIAIDLPGSGESDMPPGPYSTEGHADRSLRSSAPSASRGAMLETCGSADVSVSPVGSGGEDVPSR
jgi:pimeloyl-ACP methyl ester carboxylesterase